MIILVVIVAMAVGALAGAVAAKLFLSVAPLTARERRNYLDSIALARDVQLTPDALTLRPRAASIIAAFDADDRKDS